MVGEPVGLIHYHGKEADNAMAFQSVPQTVSVQVRNKLPDNQDFIVDLAFWRGVTDPTVAEMFALGDDIDQWWTLSIMPYLSDTVAYFEVVCNLLTTATSLQTSSTSGSIVGGVGTEQAPNAQAACISLRTGMRGRSFRGRNYISGVPNASIAVNHMDPTFMTTIESGYRFLLAGGAYDPSPFSWVVISRRAAGFVRPVGVTTQILNAFFVDDIIDDQRRRKPGVGA